MAAPIPCRLKTTHAVYESNLDPSLRPVALAFAWFANDNGENIGGNVWPSLSTIAGMVGTEKRAVRRAVSQLRTLGVLKLEDAQHGLRGGRGTSTRYRFDLSVLARLPVTPRCKGGRPRPPLPDERRAPTSGFIPSERRSPVVEKAVTGGQKGGRRWSERRAPTPSDPTDPTDPTRTNIELTDAIASEHAENENPDPQSDVPATPTDTGLSTAVEAENEDPKADADVRVSPPTVDDDTDDSAVPWTVYQAIAYRAFDVSLKVDGDDSAANISEHFKVLCAQQGIFYGDDIAAKAVREVLYKRERAKRTFSTKFEQVAGRRFSTTPRLVRRA